MKGKVVLITGGSSGIGRALALAFGRHGSRIFFTGQTPKHIRDTESALKRAGVVHQAVNMDVSQEKDNEKLIAAVIATYGQLDVLVVNAGITRVSPFGSTSLDDFSHVMQVNFWSAVCATHYALPQLARTKGQIIAVSSVQGWRSLPTRSAYAASKFAMQGFFEVIRTEVAHKGISVLVACPGNTQSNVRRRQFEPNGQWTPEMHARETKMMSATKAAHAIYRAACRKKRDLILTREGRQIVWLNKLFPSVADQLVTRYVKKNEGQW